MKYKLSWAAVQYPLDQKHSFPGICPPSARGSMRILPRYDACRGGHRTEGNKDTRKSCVDMGHPFLWAVFTSSRSTYLKSWGAPSYKERASLKDVLWIQINLKLLLATTSVILLQSYLPGFLLEGTIWSEMFCSVQGEFKYFEFGIIYYVVITFRGFTFIFFVPFIKFLNLSRPDRDALFC